MPKNLTGANAWRATITSPTNGDKRTAQSVEVGLQECADSLKFLHGKRLQRIIATTSDWNGTQPPEETIIPPGSIALVMASGYTPGTSNTTVSIQISTNRGVSWVTEFSKVVPAGTRSFHLAYALGANLETWVRINSAENLAQTSFQSLVFAGGAVALIDGQDGYNETTY